MPDSWAIKQLFPIMPIHRLNEEPTRRAVLGDITCDSDGKIDQFIDLRDVPQHPGTAPLQRPALLPGRVPAGGLPGDPRRPAQPLRRHQRRPRQHRRRRRGRISTRVIKGDTVREVLAYVQYSADELIARMRKDVERAVRAGRITLNESRQLVAVLRVGAGGVYLSGGVLSQSVECVWRHL